jgi:zinc transporter 1/2/3
VLSVLIGLTLAVSQNFEVLFVVLVFHQTFEGLGLGARLAYTQLPGRWGRLAPPLAAIAYGVATPLGIAVGLGIRNTYAPGGATASIVSGVLDALSAGILIYTGLVEVGSSACELGRPSLTSDVSFSRTSFCSTRR